MRRPKRKNTRSLRAPTAARPRPVVEPLEPRLLLNGALPCIVGIEADNRGLVELTVSRALDPTTVTSAAAQIVTAGADRIFGTADDILETTTISYDAGSLRVSIAADLAADTRYQVRLDGALITDETGQALDAEFNGVGQNSGDGVAGGQLSFFTSGAETPIARFITILGRIDVELFKDATPESVRNFLNYVNSGRYDNTIVHRSIEDFIVQGGVFAAGDSLTRVPTDPPIINEPFLSNTRGTIALAKLSGDPNSATSSWFFNLGDNSDNLDNQNGGFTVFGEITNDAGLAVMDALGALQRGTINLDGFSLQDAPLLDGAPIDDLSMVTIGDLPLVERVSLLMDVSAGPVGQLNVDSFTIENKRGVAVTIYDIAGVGLEGVEGAVRVVFDGKRVEKIILNQGLPAGVGIAISGASSVGLIRDRRPASDASTLAFIATEAPVETLQLTNRVEGFNLNGVALRGVFLGEDADGDGDLNDLTGVALGPGAATKIAMTRGLQADLLAGGGLASLLVRGQAENADIVVGESPADAPPMRLTFGAVRDVSLHSETPIDRLRAVEWIDGDFLTDEIEAPAMRLFQITGARRQGVAGDFEADLTLTGVEGSTRQTLRAASVRGAVQSSLISVRGDTGLFVLGGGASNTGFTLVGDVRAIVAKQLVDVEIFSTGSVSSVIVTNWRGGAFSAGFVDRLISTGRGRGANGDLNMDVRLAGIAATGNAARLISARGGAADAAWRIAGDVGAVSLRGDARNLSIDIDFGDLFSFRARQAIDLTLDVERDAKIVMVTSWEGGALRADAVNTLMARGSRKLGISGDVRDVDMQFVSAALIDVRGHLVDSDILATQNPFLVDRPGVKLLHVGGMIDNTVVRSNAEIGGVIAGALRDARILASTSGDLAGFPGSPADVGPLGQIRLVQITGMSGVEFAVSNSFIVADRILSASFGAVRTDGAGDPFGLAGNVIEELTFVTTQDGRVTLKRIDRDLRAPVAFGDFQIRVGLDAPA